MARAHGRDGRRGPTHRPLACAFRAGGERPAIEEVHRAEAQRAADLRRGPANPARDQPADRGPIEVLDMPGRLGCGPAAGRRAERFRSSGTSITTARATRVISRSSRAGNGTCSSTCVAYARSYAPSAAGTARRRTPPARDLRSRRRPCRPRRPRLEADPPHAEARRPRTTSTAAVTAADVRDHAGTRIPIAVREMNDVLGLRIGRQRAPAAVGSASALGA